ncbi:MAG: hypothetical protein HY225_03615 [Candidatus Vogelbacteria bacterium]|nr:hypothetical protein [Candidatus Vogelbacteria bacterium]
MEKLSTNQVREKVNPERVLSIYRDARSNLEVSGWESPKTPERYFKISFLADGTEVENQEISIIDEGSKIVATFKLVRDSWQKALDRIQKDKHVKNGEITYSNKDFSFNMCHAASLDSTPGLKVYVAKPSKNEEEKKLTSQGLIRFEFDKPTNPTENEETYLQAFLVEVEQKARSHLGITGSLLSIPPIEAENRYKIARYKWSHDITRDLTEEEKQETLYSLKRAEVAPGYFTFVEKGRADKIREIAPYFLYHTMSDYKNLPTLLRSGALVSTHERYKVGMGIDGWSSKEDLEKGGGDFVFLRMYANNPEFLMDSEKSAEVEELSSHHPQRDLQPNIIFDNALLDRTDHFCYPSDRYGSTDPEKFESRITSEELARRQFISANLPGNEIAFRNGISNGAIRYVTVRDEETKQEVIKLLLDEDIKEINGRPVEDVIIVTLGKYQTLRILEPDMDLPGLLAKQELKKLQNRYSMFDVGTKVEARYDNLGKDRIWADAKVIRMNGDLTVDIVFDSDGKEMRAGVDDIMLKEPEPKFKKGDRLLINPKALNATNVVGSKRQFHIINEPSFSTCHDGFDRLTYCVFANDGHNFYSVDEDQISLASE